MLDGVCPNRAQMDRDGPTQSGPEMPPWWRSIKKWFRHTGFLLSWTRNALCGLALDFESDLIEPSRPEDVEHADDVAVHGLGIAADKHLRVGILPIHLLQL